MSPKIAILIFTLQCFTFVGISQNKAFSPVNFTWEGASTGNKAKWKANDNYNEYLNIGGVDVRVRLIDSFGINTTTSHPSEFNDWTKTNTFYGKGNFALQITATSSRQPVCMEFLFSKPVYLNRFNVYDIDMIQSGTNHLSTYQDSISVYAFNKTGNVPLILQPLSPGPTYSISNQSAKANYFAGVNGDVSHLDPNGAINILSLQPLEKFTLCYANGSEDDGLSNSHAISIPGFEFSEFIGSISGYVLEDVSDKPLAGSLVTLYNENGQIVTNKAGVVMQKTTGSDGYYYFPSLPLGNYRIVQVNPPDYLSVRDTDGANDDIINVTIDLNTSNSINNNFYEIQTSPLAVSLSDMQVKKLGSYRYQLMWKTYGEKQTDSYEISLSDDGTTFYPLGKIKSSNRDGMVYNFEFDSYSAGNVYVRLTHIDYEGRLTVSGILRIDQSLKDFDVFIFPNPFIDVVNIEFNEAECDFEKYLMINNTQQIIIGGIVPSFTKRLSLDVKDFPAGTYYLLLYGANKNTIMKLVKHQ